MMNYDFFQNGPISKPASFRTMASVSGTDYNGTRHNIDLEDINLLCTGATKSGKTHFIKKVLSQTIQNKNSIHVLFDPKGDYLREFFQPGDVILSIKDNPNYPASAQPKWNLLRDITYDGNLEINSREMAYTIFADQQASSNPFFPQAATNLFANLLISMCRHCSVLPTTKAAIQKICSMTQQEMLKACECYQDLASTKQLIADAAPQTTAGVKGELISCLQQTFQGNFLGDGDFSLQEFIQNGVGRKLFLEYDFNQQAAAEKPIRLMLDILMKGALSDTSKADRIYFYMDEFAILPEKLTYLPPLVNFGRQCGLRVIAGLQSVAQLYASWSEKDGNALLAGFTTNIVFFCNDADSIHYFSEHAGEILYPITNLNLDFSISRTNEKLPIVPAYVLSQLSVGDAVIFERKATSSSEDQYPFWFHFDA